MTEQSANDDHTFPHRESRKISTLKDVEIAAYTRENGSRVELPFMALYASGLSASQSALSSEEEECITLNTDGDSSPLLHPLRNHRRIEIDFPHSTYHATIESVTYGVNGDLRGDGDEDAYTSPALDSHVRVHLSRGEFVFPDE